VWVLGARWPGHRGIGIGHPFAAGLIFFGGGTDFLAGFILLYVYNNRLRFAAIMNRWFGALPLGSP